MTTSQKAQAKAQLIKAQYSAPTNDCSSRLTRRDLCADGLGKEDLVRRKHASHRGRRRIDCHRRPDHASNGTLGAQFVV